MRSTRDSRGLVSSTWTLSPWHGLACPGELEKTGPGEEKRRGDTADCLSLSITHSTKVSVVCAIVNHDLCSLTHFPITSHGSATIHASKSLFIPFVNNNMGRNIEHGATPDREKMRSIRDEISFPNYTRP